MKGFFKTIGLTVITFVIMTATSCCSDADYFGLDSFEEATIVFATDVYSEHLDLDIDKIEAWSERDLNILEEAERRMGITFNDEKRQFSKNQYSYLDLNISKKLYNKIWDNYCYNNSILIGSSKTRFIRSNIEALESIYNCVPLSLQHCCNKSYEEVVRICCKHDPQWPSRGVDLGYVGAIVQDLGKQITTYYKSNDIMVAYADNDIVINGMLILRTGGVTPYHAVCAYKYNGSGDSKKIFFNDYQKNEMGKWITVSEASTLFIIH